MINLDVSSKILVVGPSVNGRGGIATVVNAYRKMLEVFAYVCTLKSLNYLGKLCDMLKAIPRFIRMLMFGSYELIHIHTASYVDFYRNAIFVVLSRLFHKKILLHIHGGEFENFYLKNKFVVNYICNKATALVAVSTYFVDFLSEHRLNRKIYLLHNVIDEPVLFEDNSFNNIFNLSFVGSICKEKGIYDVIAVLGKYKPLFQGKVLLHIAGDGDVEHLDSLIKEYGLMDMVKFWGWADVELKRRIFSFSDVFIHLSYFESFGISIAEAMSYGLPIIATRVGGIPDVVDDGVNGILVEYGNEDQIFKALLFLLEHPNDCLLMGEEASCKARCFYQSTIEPKIVKMYEELLNK